MAPSPGLLPFAFDQLLRKETGFSVGFVFEFDLKLEPGGSVQTVRFADVDAASASAGHYDGLVKDSGTSRRGIPLLGNDLQIHEQKVVLVDTNASSPLGARFWAKLTRGPVARFIPDSPVRCYMVSGALTSRLDWFLESSMVIHRWEQLNDHEFALTLRPNLFLLERAIPDAVMTEALFPTGKPENWGLFFPIGPYGRYDSLPTTRKGLLPAFCIDTVNHRYLCCMGRIDIIAVFLDGEPFTDYTVETQNYGGIDVTELRLTESDPENKPIEDQAVTFDATGYKDNAGVLITNPVSQYAHYIRNFAVGSPIGTPWRKGSWLTGNSIMNIAIGTGFLITHAFFQQRNETGAYYFQANGQHRGLDAINDWQTSQQVKAFLLNNGLLDIHLLDPAERRPTDDAYFLRQADIRSFKPRDENGLSRSVMAQYHYDPVANQYTKNVTTTDPSVPGNKGVFPHQMSWGPVNEEAQQQGDSYGTSGDQAVIAGTIASGSQLFAPTVTQ